METFSTADFVDAGNMQMSKTTKCLINFFLQRVTTRHGNVFPVGLVGLLHLIASISAFVFHQQLIYLQASEIKIEFGLWAHGRRQFVVTDIGHINCTFRPCLRVRATIGL